MASKKLFLKKNEERRVLAGHLWIYSNEIDNVRSPINNFEAGDIIEIFSSKDKFLAIGYINPHALICARVLSRSNSLINEAFFINKIEAAFQLRKRIFEKPFYRLVYAESDLLPGLVIDRYDQVFVVQTNTMGMEKLKNEILQALLKLYDPTCIVFKNDSAMRQVEGLPNYVELAHGEAIKPYIEENACRFTFPLLDGQKTGWFYDHRDNRARLKKYVTGKKVLDAFCYLGGFGIQAAKFGASEVLCVDSSARAINVVKENAKLNHCENQIQCQEEDVFIALKNLVQAGQKFDVIIIDPPAFIKKRKDIEQGVIAYLRLNELAMELLTDSGILVSCSCSLHMSITQLVDVVRRASIKTNKTTQILEMGYQGLDHPVHIAIPETAYLKALFCLVRTTTKQ